MFIIGRLNENKVLPITIQGKLTKSDYGRILPGIEALLNENKSIRFFIKLEDFNGFEMDALWEDIKFDYKHQNQYGKTAIIGDKKWEEYGTKFSSLFFDTKMKFFYEDQEDEAWNWVNS